MRAIWISKTGGPDVLEVRETPDPEPGPGQVRVRVRAAGLNFADVMARMGLYPDAPKPPCVVGYEASGVVDALGPGVVAERPSNGSTPAGASGVAGPAVGTRVMAMSRFGAQADTICVPAAQAVPIPDSMTFEQAAAIPVNYITAYHMLFRIGALRPRERVLVHMAAGGVGLAALQLCRTVEGVVTFGTASASKHDILRAEGCEHPIDYRNVDYAWEVLRLTDGKGVHIVLDALGGKDWKKGYDLLRPAGRLIAFGFANMSSGEKRSYFNVVRQSLSVPFFTPFGLMDKNRAVAGVNIGHLWDELDMLNEEMVDILRLYGEGRIKPHIDKVYPFAEAAEAHRRLQSRQNIGKVVLVP